MILQQEMNSQRIAYENYIQKLTKETIELRAYKIAIDQTLTSSKDSLPSFMKAAAFLNDEKLHNHTLVR